VEVKKQIICLEGAITMLPDPLKPFRVASAETPESIKVGFSVNSGKLGNSSTIFYKR
jgi:hypothetical protein